MGISVYDRIYDNAELARRHFEELSLSGKKSALRDIFSAANEFEAIASEWEAWATEKENELVEKGLV